LVRGTGGVAGEVADLRDDVKDELGPLAALVVEEFVDPALADTDAIKTSIASAAAEEVYEGADLNGLVGEGEMDPPRNLSVTTSAHTDIDAVDVAVEGVDVNGDAITEDITLTDGGGVTDLGAKAFKKVTKITVPAQSGAGGLLEFGFGTILGLGKKIVSRAGALAVLTEIEAGTVKAGDALAGTYADAATGAPNGTYDPGVAPDGANDYAVYYEHDPTA
jgi:hypothetical protein